jgi:hypothetical protein
MTDTMEYEIINIVKHCQTLESGDLRKQSEKIHNILTEKYLGRWGVLIIKALTKNAGGQIVFSKDQLHISFSYNSHDYFIWKN